jgi:hypothetical protein
LWRAEIQLGRWPTHRKILRMNQVHKQMQIGWTHNAPELLIALMRKVSRNRPNHRKTCGQWAGRGTMVWCSYRYSRRRSWAHRRSQCNGLARCCWRNGGNRTTALPIDIDDG